jgi:hypothetical protein
MHQIADDCALFINGQKSVVKSHPEDSEDSRYLCCLHSRHKILMCLYETFETSKKQDLTPKKDMVKKDFAFFQFHILLE